MLDFSTLLVNGVPLVIVIFGLVEFIKSFGVTGKIVTAISMALGLGIGICYQIASAGVPVGFGAWFGVVIFGLALGLTASGFYKFADARLPKLDEEI